jgi:hypothetical protein
MAHRPIPRRESPAPREQRGVNEKGKPDLADVNAAALSKWAQRIELDRDALRARNGDLSAAIERLSRSLAVPDALRLERA